MNKLDSNNLNTIIHQVCTECGIEANRLTCLKRYGNEPTKKCFEVSTYHTGICDFCKEEKPITQTRDFFYPDFSLITNNHTQ